jgi:hypothetical protein
MRSVGFCIVSVCIVILHATGAFAQWGENYATLWGDGFFSAWGYVDQPSESEVTAAGSAASDVLQGNGSGFGYALRYGGVVPGSERVSVNGRAYVRGRDYSIDYATGSLLFLKPVNQRESIQVMYRHSPELVGAGGTTKLPILALQFGGLGNVRGLFALNGVERLQDGGIRQRMSYGLTSSFNLGAGTSLSGVYFLSSQQGLHTFADPASPERRQGAAQPDILDRLLHQTIGLSQGAFHGSVTYTDVGTKFNGFEAMQGEGFSDDLLNQWKKERGITRLDYSFGFGQGGNDLTTLFNRISDGAGSIETRGLNLKAGGASLYWNSRWIDPEFARFKDLKEEERGQWAKEKGIGRESLGGAFAFAGGGLKFDQNEIRDLGGAIRRSNYSLDTSLLTIGLYEQEIGSGFSRFHDLAEGEKGQWAKEKGWKRSGFSLQLADLYGRKETWNSYQQHEIHTADGDMSRRALNLTGAGWGVLWKSTKIDAGFGGVGSLRGDEIDALISDAHEFYGDGSKGKNDKKDVLRQAGIDRDYTRLTLDQPFGKFAFDQLKMAEANGGIQRTRFGLDAGKLSFNYLDQEIDSGFGRMGDLLEFERKLYANEVGLHRRQWSLGYSFAKDGVLSLSDLAIDGEEGGLSRQRISLKAGNYDLTANFRKVDESFGRAGDLADPEKQLLSELRGFSQWDFSGKVKLLKNLQAELFLFDANNPTAGVGRDQTKYFLSWAPDGATSLSYLNDRLEQGSAAESLNDYFHQKTSYSRNLGALGMFSGYRDRELRTGVLTDEVEKTVDHWRYEGAPIGGFKLLAEQTNTRDAAGNFEDIFVRGISGKLTPRMDVAFSEKTIDRDGNRASEVHRTYGMGYDLGKGSKLNWSYMRLLTSAGSGKAVQKWGLTQTAVGNLQLSANYVEERVDGTNTKATGVLGLQTVKPFSLGPLTNAMFSFNFNSLADQATTKKEDKMMSFTADWGTNKLGVSYNGVMTGSGVRAVDRVYSFSTNPDEKLPFHFGVNYKIRTLPDGVQQMVRTYHLDYKLGDRLTLVHDLNGNPEKKAKDVPFGTVINPTGTSNWALNYRLNGLLSLKADYLTLYDDTKGKVSRKGGFRLLGKSPGGNHFWDVGYDVDASTLNGDSTIAHTFSLGYRFEVNPNNSVRLSLAHTQYEHDVPDGRSRDWITGSLDYSLRF